METAANAPATVTRGGARECGERRSRGGARVSKPLEYDDDSDFIVETLRGLLLHFEGVRCMDSK